MTKKTKKYLDVCGRSGCKVFLSYNGDYKTRLLFCQDVCIGQISQNQLNYLKANYSYEHNYINYNFYSLDFWNREEEESND